MPQVVIRQVSAKDLDACHRIESASFEPEEAASLERIAIRIKDYPQGFWVAELDGRLVGHINSGATDSDDISDEEFKALIGHDPEGRNQVVFSLAVLPAQREKGIARALLERYITESRKAAKHSVLLLCKEELLEYYSRFGFENRGLSASTHGGAAWYEMVLRLI